MFHHPLFQSELDVHLKLQTVRDSELLLWWNKWSNLIPWEQHLSLGYLKQKIEHICSGTLRTRLMNWLRNFIQMLYIPELS